MINYRHEYVCVGFVSPYVFLESTYLMNTSPFDNTTNTIILLCGKLYLAVFEMPQSVMKHTIMSA